ncbi:LOW QUALITY PROTEIN: hypothetical protein M8C21_019272 [Ambrosia artemisiifolia]|uniref:PGG domain-containing protein n=1 Tax=Ambrosia artemisiifolia TaxID=4212 RepID=A0AAD5GZ77_AMBAR|nr:LOW QUALITY PROTEIN: hypothetical protein M8C21_019272 [Ambrosia artemisiifolia]
MEIASSSNELHVSTPTHDLKFMMASNVNVSNFVSVKLSGCSNYNIWKAQMLCLIESQVLLHILNGEQLFPVDKGTHMISQYDKLVKGWIFGSVNEKVLKDLIDSGTAQEVWMKLESLFNLPVVSETTDEISPGFLFRVREFESVPEMGDTDNIKVNNELYEAAVEGCWWKAKSILKNNKKAASEAVTNANGNTILHIAIEMGHNYFLEKLLNFLKDGKDIEKQNSKGQTALHIAAAIGNTHAAQLLVRKRERLLHILDINNKSPLDISFTNTMTNTCACLLRYTRLRDFHEYIPQKITNALVAAILAKEYDLAQKLLVEFPEQAKNEEIILGAITVTFPTDLSFGENFIYPYDVLQLLLKIKNNIPDSDTVSDISVDMSPYFVASSNLFYVVFSYVEVTVRPIKNIEKKRKDYQKAKKILSLICDQMGTSNHHYRRQLFEAVLQDTHEVVDAILFKSPATINYNDEEGYNIIQLSIINRAEKVYNLIHHIIERKESYRDLIDYSENNLVHLAGRLAPSFILERTTGAALQLQRELLWYEEVKKLKFPLELRNMNKNMETPQMVFTREHRDLIKEGENWIKKTAESCSITAALIVTVVFAAAITVPGGSNQESGIPVFKKETAFLVFAVSNAFSLFTASTALLLYLSILTMRFSERDFLFTKKVDFWSFDVIPLHNCYDGSLWCNLVPCIL